MRIDARARVSLFAYDSETVVVGSFRPDASSVGVSVAGRHARLRDLETGKTLKADGRHGPDGPTTFRLTVQAHSFTALQPG